MLNRLPMKMRGWYHLRLESFMRAFLLGLALACSHLLCGERNLIDHCHVFLDRLSSPDPTIGELERIDHEGRVHAERIGIRFHAVHNTHPIPWEGNPDPLVSVAFDRWGYLYFNFHRNEGRPPQVGVYAIEGPAAKVGRDNPLEHVFLHPGFENFLSQVSQFGYSVHLDPAMAATETNAQFHATLRRLAFTHHSQWHEAVHEFQHLLFHEHFGVSEYKLLCGKLAAGNSLQEVLPIAEQHRLHALGLETEVMTKAAQTGLPPRVAGELMAVRAQLRELEKAGIPRTNPAYVAIERYALAYLVDPLQGNNNVNRVTTLKGIAKFKMPHLMNILFPNFPFAR